MLTNCKRISSLGIDTANFFIHGFRKGNEVTIKVHLLITYPFGHSYHDDVLYDVGVEMDACHILLG